jgi:uncharacterized protein YbjT (DUF2867 family)
MAAANEHIVVVFGGTGFLGRRVVQHLRQRGISVRIGSRHPRQGQRLFGVDDPKLQSIKVNIHDERSVAEALTGAYGVVNAVSLYVEHGQQTFQSVHVESAERVAAQATRAGVERLVHVSGIGSDATSASPYIRKRGEGELAIRDSFAKAILTRPAVMFGPGDAFLTTILKLLRRLPIYPMFGHGLTKLQPVYVDDVAEAIAAVLLETEARATTYECGGPRIYTYRELLGTIAQEAHLECKLIPVPFAAWLIAARVSEFLQSPPITRNQVELMQVDNISSAAMPGLDTLGIQPHPIEEILREMLETGND